MLGVAPIDLPTSIPDHTLSLPISRTQHFRLFLRIVRKANLQEKLLGSFYRCSIEMVGLLSSRQTGKPFSGSSILHRGSSAAHGHLWKTYSVFSVSEGQPTYWKIHHTLDTICLTRCPLVDASGQSNH